MAMLARCLIAVFFVVEASAYTDKERVTSVLQKDAEAGTFNFSGLGDTIPLSEKGYTLVSKLKKNNEMEHFIRRLVKHDGGRIVDVAQFKEIVPSHSGVDGVRSLAMLKAELKSAPWVEHHDDSETTATSASLPAEDELKQHLEDSTKEDSTKDEPQDASAVPTQTSGDLDAAEKKEHEEDAKEEDEDNSVLQTHATDVQSSSEDDSTVNDVSNTGIDEDSDQTAQEAFKDFDLDKDGFITKAELKLSLGRFDREFSDAEVEDMIAQADSDGDGQIRMNEFKMKMQD